MLDISQMPVMMNYKSSRKRKNQILRKIQLIRIKLKVLMIWKKTK